MVREILWGVLEIVIPVCMQESKEQSKKEIPASGGGSNSSLSSLWKSKLQRLSNETGLIIDVCHFPPAPSKWNKIEHRLFLFIAQNWCG
jgi:hypothetical protein